jgi:hypothetical protein
LIERQKVGSHPFRNDSNSILQRKNVGGEVERKERDIKLSIISIEMMID